MIHGPGYLDQAPGMGLGNQYVNPNLLNRAPTVNEIAEMEMKERENQRRMWLDNMPDTARSLDYIRRQLRDVDMQAEAKAIDMVITAMINRWNEERCRL